MEDKIRFSNEKALRTVESLLDPVSEEYLIECATYIETRHYVDVVEERAISSLCGYPPCSNPLTDIPKQKYHISLKSNRVYDLTQRKNFCSNFCYKASHFFETQLSPIPVWSKESKQGFFPKINLMYETDKQAGGVKPGKEIEFVNRLKKDDIENVCHDNLKDSTTSSFHESDEQDSEEELIDDDKSGKKYNMEKTMSFSPDSHSPPSDSEIMTNMATLQISSHHNLSPATKQSENLLLLLEKTLKEWYTQKTLKLLNQQNILEEDPPAEAEDSGSLAIQSPKIVDSLDTGICLSLPIDSSTHNTNLLDTYNQKAKLFLGKAVKEKSQASLNAKEQGEASLDAAKKEQSQASLYVKKEQSKVGIEEETMNNSQSVKSNSPVILPPVDTIRKRIVLEKLHQVFPKILTPLELKIHDIARALKLIINTFQFERHNVTFRPVEWLAIAMALLLLIGKHDRLVAAALKKEKNQIILTKMMSEHNIVYSAILQTLETCTQ